MNTIYLVVMASLVLVLFVVMFAYIGAKLKGDKSVNLSQLKALADAIVKSIQQVDKSLSNESKKSSAMKKLIKTAATVGISLTTTLADALIESAVYDMKLVREANLKGSSLSKTDQLKSLAEVIVKSIQQLDETLSSHDKKLKAIDRLKEEATKLEIKLDSKLADTLIESAVYDLKMIKDMQSVFITQTPTFASEEKIRVLND